MHIRAIAVGDRQPAWVQDAVSDYAARLPRQWKFRIDTLATARRKHSAASADDAMDDEAKRIVAALRPGEALVLLDERGKSWSSRELAQQIESWQSDGRDVALVIGGPDGVTSGLRQRADQTWSLSGLTLPHGLVRVLLAEQLYRGWSILSGHPYHRD